MRLSFVLYFSSTNSFFTTFVINIGFKMKVSGAILSAAWINSTALLLPKKRWPLQYNCTTASKKRWKPLPRSGENRFQEAVKTRIYANELPCSGDAAVMQRWCSGDAAVMQRWCSGDAAVMQRWCSGDAAVMQRWCSGDAAVCRSTRSG